MAFVLDESHDFRRRCNLEMVDLEPLDEADDIDLVRDLLIQHAGLHRQHRRHAAAEGLGNDGQTFVKVMPLDYRRCFPSRIRLRHRDWIAASLEER